MPNYKAEYLDKEDFIKFFLKHEKVVISPRIDDSGILRIVIRAEYPVMDMFYYIFDPMVDGDEYA